MAHGMSLQGAVDFVINRGWTWTRLLIAALIIHGVTIVASRIRDHHEASSFARRHDCRPPPELTKRWPLGIDRIKQIWDANADGRLLAFFCSVASGYEPRNTIQQFFLVGPRAYNVLDPENVEAILSTNFQDYGFGTRPAVFAPLLGNGIFTQEGAPWKHSRDRKQFAKAQYQKLDRAFCEHVDNLIANLPRDGGIVDLQPLFFRLTLDVASALLFGKSVYSLRADTDQSAQNKLFAESFNIAQEGLAKRFRLAPFHHFYNPPAFRQACRNVHRFVEEYIEERGLVLNNSTGQPTSSEEDERTSWFIEQIAAESTSAVDLRDQLLNILLAGRDTTAC